VANDANFVYSVTTNGTLLDVERIRFLVQNRFGITISLDGPKEIHDQNRVFGGGKGSFDIVLRNLLLIRHENKDYFEKYVSIHAAVSPFHKRRMEILMDYFSGLGVEKIDLQRTVGTADACRGSCVGRSRSSPSIEREGGVTDFLVERFRKKEYNKIPMFQRLRYIDYLRSPDMPCAIPACGAGFRKMAVSPEGRLLLCYQFLDTELTIGNIDTGVDHDMVYAIYSKVQQPPGGCHSCWAIRFCGSGCLRLIYNARDFVISTPFCIATREIATRILRLYVRIARDTPESYEEYLKYIHSRKPSDFLEKTVYD